ncbi:MAG: prepilin-type N-terminal cleavage/methylation domain-containing protein [Acidothermus sp.]|nr:prepilin-type N-terminal cleavage/methylation domain-containing protein [Acidothermus sp.]
MAAEMRAWFKAWRLRFGRRRRNADARDGGLTLVELLVAMTVFSVLIVVSIALYMTMAKTTTAETQRATANDQVRLAVWDIERQVRSGNVLYSPSLDSSGNPIVLVYTQANGNQRCVEWRYNVAKQALETRSWTTTYKLDGNVSPWRVVAIHVVNDLKNPAQQPFVLNSAAGYGGRLLDLHFFSKSGLTSGSPAEIASSVAGRNTSYGYSPNLCLPIPPG